MKKILVVFTIILLACSNAIGQGYRYVDEEGVTTSSSDGFFTSNYSTYREDVSEWGIMPVLPRWHGYELDHTARVPLGSGALLLGVFGLGYALKKRNSRKEQE